MNNQQKIKLENTRLNTLQCNLNNIEVDIIMNKYTREVCKYLGVSKNLLYKDFIVNKKSGG